MVELVTGHAGMDHVDASDIRALLKGLVGNVNVLLPNSDDPNMTPSLNMKIPALNFLWLQGNGMGHCRLDGTDTVNIAGTSQGMYRKDYICIKYTLNQSDSTESLSLDVLQGSPSNTRDGANVPEYTNTATEKWLHLYEVVVYQNTVQTVTFMWPIFKAVSDATDINSIKTSLGFNNGVLSEASGGRLQTRTLSSTKGGTLPLTWKGVTQNGFGMIEKITDCNITLPASSTWLIIARANVASCQLRPNSSTYRIGVELKRRDNGASYGRSIESRGQDVRTYQSVVTVASGSAIIDLYLSHGVSGFDTSLGDGTTKGFPYEVSMWAIRLF